MFTTIITVLNLVMLFVAVALIMLIVHKKHIVLFAIK